MIESLREVMFEVTRRCNFLCDHCMRGDAQNVDLPHAIVQKFFNGVPNLNYISSIAFTGGEPLLKPNIIKYILDELRHREISVGSFYIATNGSQSSDDVIRTLMDLHLYAEEEYEEEGGGTVVEISNDHYHLVETCGEVEASIKRLKCLSFVRNKFVKDSGRQNFADNILPMGRAADWGGNHGRTYEGRGIIENYPDGEAWLEDGMVYISVYGDVLPDCDLSFEKVDGDEYSLFSIVDSDLETFIEENW